MSDSQQYHLNLYIWWGVLSDLHSTVPSNKFSHVIGTFKFCNNFIKLNRNELITRIEIYFFNFNFFLHSDVVDL